MTLTLVQVTLNANLIKLLIKNTQTEVIIAKQYSSFSSNDFDQSASEPLSNPKQRILLCLLQTKFGDNTIN